jgi:Flp pilus assembly protein TadD
MQASEEGPEECFVKAISLQEGLPEAVGNLGIHYLLGGRFPEAVRCFELSLKGKGSAPALSNLGISFFLQGLLDESSRCFERAIALDEAFNAGYENLAVLFQKKGWLEEARRAHAKAVQYSLGLVVPFKDFSLCPLVIEQALPLKGKIFP